MSFGGKSWPIDSADMNLGRVSRVSNDCLGGIFDLTQGSSIVSGGGNPNWVVGDVFLKNVYSVYRSEPSPSVGFAALSSNAGASGTPSTSSPAPSTSLTTGTTGTPAGTGSSSTSSSGSGSSSGCKYFVVASFSFFSNVLL